MNRSSLRALVLPAALLIGLWLTLRYLFPIFLPFLLAGLLALAAEPLVRSMERKLHLPRNAASGIGVLICLALTVLIVLILCALLLKQLSNISSFLPDWEEAAMSGLNSLESFLLSYAQKAPASVSPILTHGVEGVFGNGSMVVDQIVAKLLSLASGVLSQIPDSALSFGTWILASFMLSAKLPKLHLWIKGKIPSHWRAQYFPAAKRLKKNLLGWLWAQLKLTAITLFILCTGFLLLGIDHAPLWAFLISLVDALPILGTGTILMPWSLICFLQGNPPLALGLLGIYAAAVLTRSTLEPRLIGKELGLDPLVTLLAMYAGYRLWGIIGMLFSPLLVITLTQLATGFSEKTKEN